MNDNPSGAVNPVGATPGANPNTTTPVVDTAGATLTMPQPITPTPQTNPVIPGAANPAIRPMEQATPEEPPKKKKHLGLIIGLVAAAVLLIGGGIVAALVVPKLLANNDPVTMAIGKIMRGEAPNNIAIDGDINITINDKFASVSNINISLKSGVMPNSLINNSSATVTATIRNVGDVTVEVDEIYAAGDDLYFKIDGATDAIEDSGILYLLNVSNQLNNSNQTNQVIDCGDDETCQSDEVIDLICEEGEECKTTELIETEEEVLEDGGQVVLDEDTIEFFSSMVDAIELIDGEWLRISLDDLKSFADSTATQSGASCIVDLVSGINTNSNSAAELYGQYPFIVSTSDGVDLASKQSTVYKVGIDNENFAGFVNSIHNSALSEKIYSCLDLEDNVWLDANDAAGIANDLPTFYAEIDEEYNFTRLYLVSDIYDGEGTVTMDLNFSYPDNINVAEPVEYQDFSEVIQNISETIYSTDDGVDN